MVCKISKFSNIYAIYSVLFICMLGFVFCGFIITGKSFLWYVDGAYEHFTYLIYMGEFLRDLVNNFESGNFLNILDNWDFSIAQGGDAITSLHYFALGDPLCLLAFFFEQENMHILYNLLVVIRFWLTGISFVFYSKKMKFPSIPTLAGAFVYCFSGYALFSGVRHPFFLNPMIWLPIIMIGVEELLKQRKSKLFVFAIMMSLLSNFYFFYSITILMAGYFLFRFVEIYRRDLLKNSPIFLCGIWRYCLGVIWALPLFLPVLTCLLNSARFNYATSSIPLYFDKMYYLQFFLSLVSPYNNNAHYTMMEYSGVALFCLVALYCNAGNKSLKVGIISCIMVLWVPYACYLMNARAYISNRWTYGLAFLVGIAVVKSFDMLIIFNKKFLIGSIVSVVTYVIGTVLIHIRWGTGYSKIYFPACLFLGLALILIFLFMYLYKHTHIHMNVFRCGLLGLTLVGIIINSYYRYMPAGRNYINEFIDWDKQYEYVTMNAKGDELIAKREYDSWYRVEYNYADNNNEAVIEQYNGTRYSLGLMPKYTVEYLRELQDVDTYFPSCSTGLDDRVYLESLAGVKYYVVNSVAEGNVPYGYSLVDTDGDFKVYENEYVMPLGCVYDKVISTKVFENKNIEEKQQILLDYLVLQDEDYINVDSLEKQRYHDIPYEIVSLNENAIISAGCIEVIKDNAEIELRFEGMPDCETYLKLENLQFSGVVNTAGYIDVLGEHKNNKFNLQTPKAQWYFGFDDYFCNMGYCEEGQSTIRLEILRRGKYTFDDLKIICLPMSDYVDKIEQRTERVLENISVVQGNVKGTVEAKEGEWLFLSIPYSIGWSAYVNGEEVEIEKANYMYQAVPLNEGINEIELYYRTPGLLEGILITGVVGSVVFLWELCRLIKKNTLKQVMH